MLSIAHHRSARPPPWAHCPGGTEGSAVAAADPRLGSVKRLPAILGSADKNRERRGLGSSGSSKIQNVSVFPAKMLSRAVFGKGR